MNQTILTASQARANIYQLIKSVSRGLKEYIIKPKNADAVILVNKEEYDSLKETAEILAISGAQKSIEKGLSQSKTKQGIKLEDI